MKVLFICDENEGWNYYRNLFSSHFSKLEIVFLNNPNDVLDRLNFDGPFSIIFIDAALKEGNPSQLAESIIEVSGERPLVFIGEKIHIDSRIDKDLYENSENHEIIYRPIKTQEFVEVVQKCIDWLKEEEFEEGVIEAEEQGFEFIPMRIRNFYLHKALPYDVFLELTPNKYIKIFGQNEEYNQGEIQSYTRKGVKELHLLKNDFLKVLEESSKKVRTLLNKRKKMKREKLLQCQTYGVSVAHQFISTIGVSGSLIELCDEIITTTPILTNRYNNLKEVIESFSFDHFDLADQAVMTNFTTDYILKELNWASETSRKKLGLASILYDSTLPNEELALINGIEDIKLSDFTEGEQEAFKNHPKKASSIASNFLGYSDVEFIIMQHHERADSSGFPLRVSINKLSAHSCTFIIATNFVNRLAILLDKKNKDSEFEEDEKKTISEVELKKVYKELKNLFDQGNFKDPIKALMKTLFPH